MLFEEDKPICANCLKTIPWEVQQASAMHFCSRKCYNEFINREENENVLPILSEGSV